MQRDAHWRKVELPDVVERQPDGQVRIERRAHEVLVGGGAPPAANARTLASRGRGPRAARPPPTALKRPPTQSGTSRTFAAGIPIASAAAALAGHGEPVVAHVQASLVEPLPQRRAFSKVSTVLKLLLDTMNSVEAGSRVD
jgi:hypothetical protein